MFILHAVVHRLSFSVLHFPCDTTAQFVSTNCPFNYTGSVQDCSAKGTGPSNSTWLSAGESFVDFFELRGEYLLPLTRKFETSLLQIGFIGRLDYQKGVDIILSAIPELMQDDVQFVGLPTHIFFFLRSLLMQHFCVWLIYLGRS